MSGSGELGRGRDALELIDRVLASRPKKDDKTLSDATQAICDYREALVATGGDPNTDAESRRRLENLNSVLAVVLGMHFPLSAPPWDELEKARGWLDALLAETVGAVA